MGRGGAPRASALNRTTRERVAGFTAIIAMRRPVVVLALWGVPDPTGVGIAALGSRPGRALEEPFTGVENCSTRPGLDEVRG